MKKVLTAPVKNLLVPLGLTSAALAASSNVFGTTSSTIPNKEMNDITKIIKSWMFRFIDKNFFIETIKHETKEQRVRCFGNFLGTLGVSLLRNILGG